MGFWAIPSASIPERGHHGHHSSVLAKEVSSPRQGPWAERLGLFWKNWLNPQKQQYRVRAGRRYQWTKDSCSMYYTSTITRIQSTTSRDIAPQWKWSFFVELSPNKLFVTPAEPNRVPYRHTKWLHRQKPQVELYIFYQWNRPFWWTPDTAGVKMHLYCIYNFFFFCIKNHVTKYKNKL